MEILMFLVIFVAVYHVVDAACDYSSLGANHTMCIYSGQGQGCTITKREFSASDKDEMVKAHNEKRQKVANGKEVGQPSASNMKEVRWDDELATIAQRWADQCKFGHDTNRNSKKFGYAGQNAFMFGGGGGVDFVRTRQAVMAWYNEVTRFNTSDIKPFKFNYGAGHYTQVSWATTEAIGCGVIFFTKAEKKTGRLYQMIVCNYGPGGNYVRESMYETGPACSKCKNGCSTTYPGLCK